MHCQELEKEDDGYNEERFQTAEQFFCEIEESETYEKIATMEVMKNHIRYPHSFFLYFRTVLAWKLQAGASTRIFSEK